MESAIWMGILLILLLVIEAHAISGCYDKWYKKKIKKLKKEIGRLNCELSKYKKSKEDNKE